MKCIKLHDKYFKPFITNQDIEKAIKAVADNLNHDYAETDDDPPVLLSVLNGSFMFTASLVKYLKFQAVIAFIKVSSYCGTKSNGKVKQIIGLKDDLKGKRVVIVEDIVESGNTICELHRLLNEAGVKDIKICTLLFKPDSYKKEHNIDYPAIKIPNDFIVGFGLDYNELGRQYEDLYIIDE